MLKKITMKSLVFTSVFPAILATAVMFAAAQGPKANTRNKEGTKTGLPEMSRNISKLSVFVGTWATMETHEWNDWSPGGEGKGTSVVSVASDGLSVVEDYKSTMPFGSFTSRGVTVWDASEQVYKRYGFDSMNTVTVEQICKWRGPDFVCEGDMTSYGTQLRSKITTTDITATSRKSIYEITSDDGRMKELVTITYTSAAGKR